MLLNRLSPRRQVLRACVAPSIFLALTLAVLHAALFQRGNLVLSSAAGDLVSQFIPWRDFGFGQWKHGNFPLWNPYIYGGTPYFAGFQSALLYPPNWLHLILPLETAINWIIAIHLFAAGYFTYLWCRGRAASVAAGILAGIMFMFSGPYFLHIYAGHMANISVMVWVPLFFLAIDKLDETGTMHWCLLGILSVAMQILGGHPQYLYYAGLIGLLYTAIALVRSKHRLALASGYVIIYAGACILTAVQLLAGLQAAGESVRASGASFDFASMFALPPENLLTLMTPGLFGKLPMPSDAADTITYWGRCYLWEVSIFISITGLVLAIYGAIAARRKTLILSSLIVLTLILALGKHLALDSSHAASDDTSFYRLLYNYLPEYSHFRVVAKFVFLLCLFLCPLAATGFDLLLARPKSILCVAIVTGTLALAFTITAVVMGASSKSNTGDGGLWVGVLNTVSGSHEAYIPGNQYLDRTFIQNSERVAAHSVGWAAATLGTLSVLLGLARIKPQAGYLLILLATIELIAFALHSVSTSDPDPEYPPEWLNPIRAATHDSSAADFRVLNTSINQGAEIAFLDVGMSLGIQNLWGYDPGVLKRYAEVLSASQGSDPDQANQYLEITHGPIAMFQMLRCRFALSWPGDKAIAREIPNPMPVTWLVPHWEVMENRDDTLRKIFTPGFDPRQNVILESSPGISPPMYPSGDAVRGPADVIASSTDSLEIRTTIPTPEILLITNNFSSGWHVVPLETTAQSKYQIIPANHTLMAIPLSAGTHHFRLEYLPTAFRIGKWISIIALLAYAGACLNWCLKRR